MKKGGKQSHITGGEPIEDDLKFTTWDEERCNIDQSIVMELNDTRTLWHLCLFYQCKENQGCIKTDQLKASNVTHIYEICMRPFSIEQGREADRQSGMRIPV